MTKAKRWYFRFSIVFAVVSFLMMGLLEAKASNDPAPPDRPGWPPRPLGVV